jgi:hypothetical protein
VVELAGHCGEQTDGEERVLVGHSDREYVVDEVADNGSRFVVGTLV